MTDIHFGFGSVWAEVAEMKLIKAKAVMTKIGDRNVLKIPINNHDYMTLGNLTEDGEERIEEREWYLMIESSGKTWIWDSWIMEG